jgi:ribosomal protein L11 methylase PrmA
VIVKDPYWEERRSATQKPDALWVNLDKPRAFGFGFGLHPTAEQTKPKKPKKHKK